jgi:hypothetical protein
MALQKTVMWKGLEVEDCYIKVSRVSGYKEIMEAMVELKTSAEAAPLQSLGGSFTPDLIGGTDGEGANFFKQAYEAMKAGTFNIEAPFNGSFFADAIDV